MNGSAMHRGPATRLSTAGVPGDVREEGRLLLDSGVAEVVDIDGPEYIVFRPSNPR